MDRDRMAAALSSLGNFTVKFRVPIDRIGNSNAWYASVDGVEIKDGSILKIGCGNGASPDEAIEDCFRNLTQLKSNEYLVLHAYSTNRTAIRWNGFMWETVKEYA